MNNIKGISFPYCFLLGLVLLFLSCKSEPQQTSNKTTSASTGEVKKVEKVDSKKKKYILFFGDSITAGYGLDEDKAFPSMIQKRIDSIGLDYKVVNAGLSGETTAGGNGRIDWVLKQPVDIFVLELGGNDMLRGLGVEQTEANLRGILEKVKKKKPGIPIILAGMQAPPNMGNEYTNAFAKIYKKLAKEYETGFIPFILDGVGGIPSLNQADGIHPNEAGEKIVMETVWKTLKGYL